MHPLLYAGGCSADLLLARAEPSGQLVGGGLLLLISPLFDLVAATSGPLRGVIEPLVNALAAVLYLTLFGTLLLGWGWGYDYLGRQTTAWGVLRLGAVGSVLALLCLILVTGREAFPIFTRPSLDAINAFLLQALLTNALFAIAVLVVAVDVWRLARHPDWSSLFFH